MEGFQFSIPVKCFNLVRFHQIIPVKYRHLSYALQTLAFVSVIICALTESFFIVKNLKNILASAESFTPLSIVIITIFKMFTFYARKEKFYQLMDDINDLADISSTSNLLTLKNVNQFDRGIGLVYFISGSIAGGGYCVTPIISNFVNVLVFGAEFNTEMPFKALFPYDTSKTPVYELSYATFCWATYLTILMNVSYVRATRVILSSGYILYATIL